MKKKVVKKSQKWKGTKSKKVSSRKKRPVRQVTKTRRRSLKAPAKSKYVYISERITRKKTLHPDKVLKGIYHKAKVSQNVRANSDKRRREIAKKAKAKANRGRLLREIVQLSRDASRNKAEDPDGVLMST